MKKKEQGDLLENVKNIWHMHLFWLFQKFQNLLK